MSGLTIPWCLTHPLSRPSSLTLMTYMPCAVYAILPAPCTTAPLFSTHCTKHLSDRCKISLVFHADILSHDSEVSCHPPSLPRCIKFLLVPTLLHCKLFIINHPSIILILRAVLSSVMCSARQIMSPSFNISKLHQLTHLKKLLNLIKPKNELQHHLPQKKHYHQLPSPPSITASITSSV